MKRLLLLSLTLILGLAAVAAASSSGPTIAADDALRLLKEGNARYVAGQPLREHQGADRRTETAKGGQHPIATIVGCSDSREPLEILFDQGVGDIFVIRVAGNVAGPDELGTVEYGVGHLGTPVVLVLGHTSCGAVTAAVQNAKVHGNIPNLINQIKPAVARAKAASPGAGGDELLNKSIKANVWLTMETMLKKSEEVREYVKDGRVLLVGGIYDLDSGKVTWLGQHPDQGRLLAEEAKPHAMPRHMPKAQHKPEAKPGDAEGKESKAVDKAAEKAESKAALKTEVKNEDSILPPADAPEQAGKAKGKPAHK